MARKALVVLVLLLGWAGRALSQQGPDDDPNVAAGYVNNVFRSESADSVNLYNGQLTVPIPIGPEYPIGPKLRFQALLSYNSRVSEPGKPGSFDSNYYRPLVGDSALGIGWTFTAGKIAGCGLGNGGTCFYRSDGASIKFDKSYAGYLRTNDGSQYRLNNGPYSTTNPPRMWDADGNLYEFDWSVFGYNDPVATFYTRDFGRGRDGWYVSRIVDPFGNQMTVQYYENIAKPLWSYSGSACLRMTNPAVSRTWIPRVIDLPSGDITVNLDGRGRIASFTMPVHASDLQQFKTWTIAYRAAEPPNYTRSCNSATLTSVDLEEIERIDLPDGIGSYGFSYSGCMPGYLGSLTLPTGGRLDYEWGIWHFYHGRNAVLKPGCGLKNIPGGAVVQVSDRICSAAARGAPAVNRLPDEDPGSCLDTNEARYLDDEIGIVARTENVSGTVSETLYEQYAFPFGEQGSSTVNPGRPQSLTVVISPPGVDGKSRARSVLFWSAPKVATAIRTSSDRSGADLREVVYDFDPRPTAVGLIQQPACGPSAPTSYDFCPNKAVRVTSRSYEYDDCNAEGQTTCNEIGNRRLKSETTYFQPTASDGTCSACKNHRVTFSRTGSNTWEGNGRHYNLEDHSGNLGNDTRKIDTVWTPSATAWLPNLYSRRTETYLGSSKSDRFSHFDSTTGFLNGSLLWEQSLGRIFGSCFFPASPNSGVVKHEVSAIATGFFSEPWTNPCPASLAAWPGSTIGQNNDAFGKEHEYQNGLLTRSRWLNDKTPLTWSAVRYTRAPSTGWITSSFDTQGQETRYRYDALGRVTQVTAPGEAATVISYPSTTQTIVTRNGGTGLSTDYRYDYDGLGRLIRERRLMPDGTYAKRFTKYDTAGRAFFTSEWVTDATGEALSANVVTSCAFSSGSLATSRPSGAPGTYRLCFDPFGRPQQVVGSMHSSLVTVNRGDGSSPYSDTQEAATTGCINGTFSGGACSGGTDSTTVTRRDALGQITSVTEPGGDVTSYAYEVSGNLTKVTQGVQTRSFSYDPAGYLRQETTPEKGVVRYDSYGSLGNLRQRTEGVGTGSEMVVSSLYDPAGRVTCDFSGRVLDGAGNDLGLRNCDALAGGILYVRSSYDGLGFTGKLTQRVGYNPFLPGNPSVTQGFTYSGVGGRLSREDVTVTGTPSSLGTVSEEWTYNLLGLPNRHTLARRVGVDGDVTTVLSYANGLPISLSVLGGPAVVSAVTYHPYGGVSGWSAANGVRTTIAADASLLARPGGISGGSFSRVPYSYDGAGNIRAMAWDTLGYDLRSRLTSSNVFGRARSYAYDRYGNLGPSGVSAATNRLLAGVYDSRGNLLAFGTQSFEYDAFSRQTAFNVGKERYVYDGAGERLARLSYSVTGADFFTIFPCRALDTRDAFNGAPALIAGESRRVQLSGRCGVASDAAGVTGNVLAIGPAATGLFKLVPAGTDPLVSTLNFNAGRTLANNFRLGLPGTGQLTLSTSTASHAVLDVTGYYRYPTPSWTVTFRDESSRLSSEYSVTSSSASRTKNWLYFGNQLVAVRQASGEYWSFVTDHLGTPRHTYNGSGVNIEGYEYHPFGEEICCGFGNQQVKFAAMERDASSTKDYVHARYFGASEGRFLSPDKVGGKVPDPQTWNRYAYSRNNPLKYLDPDGNVVVGFTGLGNSPKSSVYAITGRLGAQPGFGPSKVFRHRDTAQAAIFVLRELRGNPSEPVIIVGHSRGSAAALDLARQLAKLDIGIALLVTLDPVMIDPKLKQAVPANVSRAVNYYQTDDNGPLDTALAGIYLTAADPASTAIENRRIAGAHSEVDDFVARDRKALAEFIALVRVWQEERRQEQQRECPSGEHSCR